MPFSPLSPVALARQWLCFFYSYYCCSYCYFSVLSLSVMQYLAPSLALQSSRQERDRVGCFTLKLLSSCCNMAIGALFLFLTAQQ